MENTIKSSILNSDSLKNILTDEPLDSINTNLINSLNALSNMQSYYDITNISQTHGDNQADMRINAKALKSVKITQDETTDLDIRVSLIERNVKRLNMARYK